MDRKKAVDAQVGAKLMQRRQALGMSQAEVAALMSLTQRMVRYYERGGVRVTTERLAEFAAALHCRPADLLPQPASLRATREKVPADCSR